MGRHKKSKNEKVKKHFDCHPPHDCFTCMKDDCTRNDRTTAEEEQWLINANIGWRTNNTKNDYYV